MDTFSQQSNNVEIDEDRQRKAREYARKRRRVSYIDMGIAAVGIIFVFLSGLNIALRNWLQPLAWHPVAGWDTGAGVFLFFGLVVGLPGVTSPLGFFWGVLSPAPRWGPSMATGGWGVGPVQGAGFGGVLV